MGEALVNAFFLKSQRGCAGRGSHKASIIDGFMEEHGEIAFTEMPCKSHGIIPIFTTENWEGGTYCWFWQGYCYHGAINRIAVTSREANDPAYIPLLKENQKEYIYHSELVLENQRIIMSDHVDIEFQTCYSNFLTIMYETKEEVQRAYEIMKEGSKTIYQLEATPYSSCRVVFVDRFGIRWGIMTEQTER